MRAGGVLGVRLCSLGLLAWGVFASEASPKPIDPFIWLSIPLIPLLGAIVLRWRHAQASTWPEDAALADRLGLPRPPTLLWVQASTPLRAVSMGWPWWSVIVCTGDRAVWIRQPDAVRLALLHHEAAHLRRGHLIVSLYAIAGAFALLPATFAALMVVASLGAALNRWWEYAADRAAARRTSPDAVQQVLDLVGEPAGWSAASWIPMVTLLLTHPPLAWRQAALRRSNACPPS